MFSDTRQSPIASTTAKRIPGLIERSIFVVAVLLSFGSANLLGLSDSTSGSPVAQVLWGSAYALSLVMILREGHLRERFKGSLPLVAILVITMLSTLWSLDPSLTLKRAFGLCGTSIIGYYLVSRYTLEIFVETLVWALTLAAIGSAIIIAVAPAEGLDPSVGSSAWRGVFFQKNGLGVAMALADATMLTLLGSATGRKRIAIVASIVLCSILLLGSKSGTGFVTLVALLGCYFLLLRLRVPNLRVPAIVILTLCGCMLICAHFIGFGLDEALGLIGRNATLTGRTDVWSIATEHIAERPLLGYGYRVFWEPDGPVHAFLLKDIGWEPDSSHNGYLEVLLNLGYVGGVVFLTFLLFALGRTYRMFARGGSGVAAWPLMAVLYQVISNFSETSLALYNSIGWVVLVAAFLYATEKPGSVSEPRSFVAPSYPRPDTPSPAAAGVG
jgi:O-antigen ligase